MTKIIEPNNSLDDSWEIKVLKKTISDKEKLLIILLEKIEQLKIDLLIIQREYNIRIGRLYLKLDEINLKILKFKKIENLLDKRYSFSEAIKIIEESLQNQYKKIKNEQEKLNEAKNIFKDQKKLNEKERQDLKKLYHELAFKFHPDLKGGSSELMKKINKAYSEGNIDTLSTIKKDNLYFKTEKLTSIDSLKNKLESLIKSITKITVEYNILKKSEWYILKENIKKAQSNKRDILDELSDKILSDIAKKENQLNVFNKKYRQ